jgi:transposase
MDITLTVKEQKRIEIIERALRNDLTVIEAAMVLGVSERQCYRLKKRIKEQGVKGVIHGNRGRPCKYKLKDQTLKRVVELARGKYRGFNDHHLSEKLREEEKIEISREKVRRVLRCAGIGSPRKRRANKHRSRRERREAEGMMLQLDASPHDWLEGRGPRLTLVGAIDDATSKVPMAFFEETETSWAYFHLFDETFKKEGLPHSVYSDRHSIFWTDREPTLAEQLQGKRPTTEVGRALEELGITLIPAGSPQAKGRIERLWGTLQDRLVSELRLAGAKTRAQAQAVLERYLPKFNRTFSIAARKAQPAWRKVRPQQLHNALCFKYQRTVADDHTVSFEGALFQIPKNSPARSYAGKRINVHVLLDGSVEFFFKAEKIARFDFKTACAFGLYRTNSKRDMFRYGPLTRSLNQLHELAP